MRSRIHIAAGPALALALAVAALTAPRSARAGEKARDPQAREHAAALDARVAARFSFLEPGRTRESEVLARAGAPDVDYDSFVLAGDADPWIDFPVPGAVRRLFDRARDEKRRVFAVHVLEYDFGGPDDLTAVVVLHEDRVLYAILPPPPAESTADRIEELLGEGQHRTDRRLVGDHVRNADLLVYPGVEYLLDGPTCVARIRTPR